MTPSPRAQEMVRVCAGEIKKEQNKGAKQSLCTNCSTSLSGHNKCSINVGTMNECKNE